MIINLPWSLELDFIQKVGAQLSSEAACVRCLVLLYTHTSFIENSIEAGNLLRGNDALHAMLGARTRARMQLALVTMMFTCLIARLLN